MTPTVGMYVLQMWPYRHPYGARTWTIEDWRAYASGMAGLGYNALQVWPMIEIMPDPLSSSDVASLRKLAAIIEMLQTEFGMKVLAVVTPNVIADDKIAEGWAFEDRPFFKAITLVDPRDGEAVARMMRRREQALSYLAAADGLVVIDSDPGGYPNSTNADFISLLAEHRRMLDRLRPGIELIYWMHLGWEEYSRFHATGQLFEGYSIEDALAQRVAPEELQDVVDQLIKLDPEPWGMENGSVYAEARGEGDRVVQFRYAAIEDEPAFPMTQFGKSFRTDLGAYEAGAEQCARGVMGNAQTHCVQLPNTFAFARGARGLPLTDADYVGFAEDLIPGHAMQIVEAWRLISSRGAEKDASVQAERIEAIRKQDVQGGKLGGLLLGSPDRFLLDLVLQLRLVGALERFALAVDGPAELVNSALSELIDTAESWQQQTGYSGIWSDDRLQPSLAKLQEPALEPFLVEDPLPEIAEADSPRDALQEAQAGAETYTTELLAAMRTVLRARK